MQIMDAESNKKSSCKISINRILLHEVYDDGQDPFSWNRSHLILMSDTKEHWWIYILIRNLMLQYLVYLSLGVKMVWGVAKAKERSQGGPGLWKFGNHCSKVPASGRATLSVDICWLRRSLTADCTGQSIPPYGNRSCHKVPRGYSSTHSRRRAR